MKLSFELKLEIYEKHLAGYSLNYLADEYHLAKTTVRHFCNLADRHGTDILRRSKKKTYSNQFKLNAINRVLSSKQSVFSISCLATIHTNQLYIWQMRSSRYLLFAIIMN